MPTIYERPTAMVTRRETDLRFATGFFALAAIALFLAGVRVLTRVQLSEAQFVLGLLLVVIASLTCTATSLRLRASAAAR